MFKQTIIVLGCLERFVSTYLYQDTCTKAGYTELYQPEVKTVGDIHARLASEEDAKRLLKEREERRKAYDEASWQDGRYESEWYGHASGVFLNH